MIEPTNRQLANFACVRIYGTIMDTARDAIEAWIDDSPAMRIGVLRIHRDFQAQINELELELREDGGVYRKWDGERA